MQVGTVWDAVGATPLIKIKSLSQLTGCEIYAKAEFLNPGGSIKDRAAKGIIRAFEAAGALAPRGTIVEGTAGNTGIGLATLAAERGYKCIISMPDNQSKEKYEILRALGAELRLVPAVPFKDQNHFYHQAQRIAAATPGAVWANQFENLANSQYHFETTGPEIWQQTQGKIDILTLSCGTGGTIGGVSDYLKGQKPDVQVVLVDPPGSGLYQFVTNGQMTTEGSSVTEGIGIMRLTANFNRAKIDVAVRIDDQRMLGMMYHLATNDGLLVGTSSGLNLRAAYELGMKHKGSGKCIVTFMCDHGSRYFSRLFDPVWLKEKNLAPLPLTA